MCRFSLAILVLLLTLSSQALVRINGAGASFPYPIYSYWIYEYQKIKKDVQINYQSIGSGGGVRQLMKQTIDFGASDVPMKAKQIKAMKKKGIDVIHIPTVVGAVVVAFNLPEVENLKLDGKTIAKIFLGGINTWDHPEIKKLNPKEKLPNKNILVVHRSDGSGTTEIFSNFLKNSCYIWKDRMGAGKVLNWKVGIGAKGNEGVSAQVKNIVGTIGYIEYSYAVVNKLTLASIKNISGKFIKPNLASISQACKSLSTKNITKPIINSSILGAYPISALTYILLPNLRSTSKVTKEIKAFLRWALTEGQKHVSTLHYSPLPKKVVSDILKSF